MDTQGVLRRSSNASVSSHGVAIRVAIWQVYSWGVSSPPPDYKLLPYYWRLAGLRL